MRGLTMRYRPELPPALLGVDLAVPAGATAGIVGRTGAGKSSLLAALFRFVEPCAGRCLLDGVDIQTLPLAAVRAAMAVIPQEPVLFKVRLTAASPFLYRTPGVRKQGASYLASCFKNSETLARCFWSATLAPDRGGSPPDAGARPVATT